MQAEFVGDDYLNTKLGMIQRRLQTENNLEPWMVIKKKLVFSALNSVEI